MSICDHSNDIASTIEFRCHRGKQEKRLGKHHFTLHITHQTKHNSGYSRYASWGSTNLLGMLNIPWQGFKKIFTTIEAHAGMLEPLVRNLEIE